MRRIYPEPQWPESWRSSYSYDLEEIYDESKVRGYAYAYSNRRSHTLRLITAKLPAGARILDVAAAQGNFSLSLAELGYRVVWNDLREELAGYVQLKYERGEIAYAPGDVFALGFKAEFDGILITEIIEHVAHPDQFLAKIAQMLKPGGYVIMTTPNGACFSNRLPRFSDCADPSVYERQQFKPNADGHIFLLWPDEVERLGTDAGLEVDSRCVFTTPLTNGHLKSSYLLKLLPRAWVFWLERKAMRLPLRLRERLMLQTGVRYRKAPG